MSYDHLTSDIIGKKENRYTSDVMLEDIISKNKILIPTIKLRKMDTYVPKNPPFQFVTIRMEDLLKEDGRTFNDTFNKIVEAGGIHKFLNCSSNVILSTIMRDKLIEGSTVDTYINAIKILEPEYYITPDGQTYEWEVENAHRELDRILSWTKEINNKFKKNSIPLGLVKGANVHQIVEHVNQLSKIGINIMVFHVGDFLRRGSKFESCRARIYAREIKRNKYNLIIYGLGAGRNIRKYFFADGFITNSHFVNAYYRQEYHHGKWRRIVKKDDKIFTKNLLGILSYINELEKQSKQWRNY